MKTCSKCGEEKTFDAFSKRGKGYQAWCKICSTSHKRDWISKNRDKVSTNTLWARYRLRPEDLEHLLETQNGQCALCDFEFTGSSTIRIDHDHSCCPGRTSCGKCIRGLLCHSHNVMMGWVDAFGRNPDLLERAKKYAQ